MGLLQTKNVSAWQKKPSTKQKANNQMGEDICKYTSNEGLI